MEKDIVIADGEKLKAIREKYKLKQSDVVGKDITRNLLSEIETNKAVITKNTAEIIIKNLKELSKKRGFEVNETVEYLMENTFMQATRILDDYIGKLKKLLITKSESFVEVLKEAKNFLADWNISKKVIPIYELAGDYYYINNDMYVSVLYYEKALTAIGKLIPSDKLLQVFSKISTAYGRSGDYDKVIETSTFVIEHFDNLAEKDIFHFTYNRAYAYYLLGNYELTILDIAEIEEFVNADDVEDYFMIFNTKAICLKKLKHYAEAISIYRSVMSILDDNQLDKKLVLQINLTEAYMALSELEKVNCEFSIVQQKLPYLKNDSCYKADLYFEAGKIYKFLNDTEKAHEYYNKAKEIAEKKKNYALLNDILYEIMSTTTNNENVDLIKAEVFKLSAKQEKLADKIIHKLIDFYMANDNIKGIKEINDFALQFS